MQDSSLKPANKDKGLWIVFTGDGKGKTEAAIGTTMRSTGYGRRVLFLQFIKQWPTGEKVALQKNYLVDFYQMGEGFVGIWGDNKPREKHENAAQDAWEFAKEALVSPKYDLVVLDEIHVAIKEGLLGENAAKECLEAINNRRADLDVVTTGRNCPPIWLVDADYATTFEKLKHPFDKGILAKRGLDF